MPGTQGRQAAEVLSGWWKPSGHNSHAAAFWLAENCPAAHTTHDWSVPFRRFPALHAEHAALPLPGVVRPVGQVWQTRALGSGAKVSFLHRVHCRCPVRLLAVPGMHGRQYGRLALESWWPNGRTKVTPRWVLASRGGKRAAAPSQVKLLDLT